MNANSIKYPQYTPGENFAEQRSSLFVSLYKGGPCMRFDAKLFRGRKIFIESDFLYNTGRELFLIVGNPQHSRVDIPAWVQSVQYGDRENEESGMLLSLSPPGKKSFRLVA